MKKKYLALAGRIREELTEIQQAVDRARTGWERYKLTSDDFYLDSVAFNLHSFYTGLERIFELIAVNGELYVSRITVMVLWPSLSCTTFGCSSRSRSRVTWLWRMSWKLTLGLG